LVSGVQLGFFFFRVCVDESRPLQALMLRLGSAGGYDLCFFPACSHIIHPTPFFQKLNQTYIFKKRRNEEIEGYVQLSTAPFFLFFQCMCVCVCVAPGAAVWRDELVRLHIMAFVAVVKTNRSRNTISDDGFGVRNGRVYSFLCLVSPISSFVYTHGWC
jgi:hypothetical protein